MHDLCLTPSHLADGSHDLVVRVADAAGETVEVPLTARVDSHAPTAIGTSPADTTSAAAGGQLLGRSRPQRPVRLPGVRWTASRWPSTAPTRFYQPQADLAFGAHTVTWSATDQAGNHRDGFWTFRVVDARAAGAERIAAPQAGSGSELRRPPLAFTLADDGSGIDPATLRVLLDGVDVAPFGTLIDGHFGYVPPADLAYGHHTVSVAVSDRYGNAMAPQQWGFDVIDATPPVLGDVRPDDGSAGADRTPADLVRRVRRGHRRRSGRDLADRGRPRRDRRAACWRAAASPTCRPIRSATAATRSTRTPPTAPGNVSAPLTWSFQVRDETPPVIAQRSPLPGIDGGGGDADRVRGQRTTAPASTTTRCR